MFKELFADDKDDSSVTLLLMKLRVAHLGSTAILRAATKYAPDDAKANVADVITTLNKFETLLDELENANKDISTKVQAVLTIITNKLNEGGQNAKH